jgi:pimeloyl-ACP methyl ester carboxylesterase/class 3 adenylate cyclase
MTATSREHRHNASGPSGATGRESRAAAHRRAGEIEVPETRYARAGSVSIAYQVVGDGPFDLVHIPSWITNVEENWNEPGYARFLLRLASFSRLILIDKRGTGLSDRVAAMPTLEQRIEDVQAVMSAVGSREAALFGSTEGSAMCALYAATYPERTRALVMYGAYARRIRSTDYPWGPNMEERQAFYDTMTREWGGPTVLDLLARSMVDDERFRRWWAGYLRRSASPGAALSLTKMNTEIDIRRILPTIRVPTLVIHRRDDPLCPVEGARYIAANIPGARYVELPGVDHMPFVGDIDTLLDPIEEFLTGAPPAIEMDRVLTTILVIDIVDSTACAVALGDLRWHALLESYRLLVRQVLSRYRGDERNVTGDGFVATFDGPGRAVRCAWEIARAVRPLGIEVRAGLHTGECSLTGAELDGIAVHIAARVSGFAGRSQIMVTSTVRELVAGANIVFTDRGRHTLRGIPGIWQLASVDSAA